PETIAGFHLPATRRRAADRATEANRPLERRHLVHRPPRPTAPGQCSSCNASREYPSWLWELDCPISCALSICDIPGGQPVRLAGLLLAAIYSRCGALLRIEPKTPREPALRPGG